ncbi:MAG: hypothetical protein WC543_00300 [Candidatus Omnitrophota bacterium]
MKIKGLIILSILCIIIMVMVLLSNRQPADINAVLKEEKLIVEPNIEYSQSMPDATIINKVAMPVIKSGVTIIKKTTLEEPAKEPEKITSANTTNSNNTWTNPSNPTANFKSENNQQTGITKTGKQPAHKELQEMNAQGIVLY